jgi:hypothetical protein
MASPAEIGRKLPDTLPEDFSEWDSENSAAAAPAERDSSESSSGSGADETPYHQTWRPLVAMPQVPAPSKADDLRVEPPQPRQAGYSDREALGERMRAINAALKSKPLSGDSASARSGRAAEDELLNAPSLMPATASADEEAFFNQLRAIGNVLNVQESKAARRPVLARATDEDSFKPEPSHNAVHRRWPIKPIEVTATIYAADEPHTPMFQSDLADLGDESQKRKKWINVGVISASFLLSVFFGVWLLTPGRQAAAKPSLAPLPAAAVVAPTTKTHKPSPAGSRSRQALAENRRNSHVEDYLMPQAGSQQVSDQLAAAPRDVKENDKE